MKDHLRGHANHAGLDSAPSDLLSRFRQAGDKLVIPAGVIHAECATEEDITYVVAVPNPPRFGEFLALLPPETAPPCTG